MVWGDRLSETGVENGFGYMFASEGSAEFLASGNQMLGIHDVD